MKRTYSIRQIIIFALMMVILIVYICFGVVFAYLYHDLNNIQDEQMQTIVNSTRVALYQQDSSMKNTLGMLNDDFKELYNAVTEGDNDEIAEQMRWAVGMAGHMGYVVSDLNGTILVSSFPEEEIDYMKWKDVVILTRDSSLVCGAGDFLTKGLCEFGSTIVKDESGEPIAVCAVVAFMTADARTISAMKRTNGVDYYIFDSKRCVALTDSSQCADSLHIDPTISRVCIRGGKPWSGLSDMFGGDVEVGAIPFVGYNGKVLGAMVLKAPVSVARDILGRLMIGIPILLFFFVGVYIFVRYVMNNIFIRPIQQLADGMAILSRGDLTKKVTAQSTCTEINQLGANITAVTEKIKNVITPVVRIASSVGGSVANLTHAATALSNSANRQAAALEEISSAMEEMGANVQQNTDNSMHTNRIAEDISGMLGSLSKATNSSYDSIKNIADDIAAINDLVEQTNILALNASVEAARAGELGQGFAVVAKEVGRLADQTHVTADGITATATESIAESEVAFRNVSELLPKVEKVVALVKEITTASVEQNSGVSQVNTALMDLNKVTQENASAAEEVAASAAQLQVQLQEAMGAVGAFRVR